jgi:transposase
MAKRKRLVLAEEIVKELKQIANSRTEKACRVNRAKILLWYAGGKRVTEIAREMKTNRPLVERTIDRALAFGPLRGLDDLPRPGRNRQITDDDRAWVLSIACKKPTEFGYAQETWTYSLLIKHIHKHAQDQGYICFNKLGKGVLHKILSESDIKPHKIRYYLERRDPEFEEKMANVLCVYKDVEMQRASNIPENHVTVSYDEKPGIQAIKNIGAELLPVPGKYAEIGRDHEYKRLGTVSLLAGIDLLSGRVIPLVKNRHRSKEFIEFLNKLDTNYPKGCKIRIVLDNHSSHISKETQRYLRDKPGRFEFVFTPKHGSWLNLIESFFSKMARSLLRHIRVQSKEELVERIYRGIEEINQEPVIFRWRYKMDEIALA